MRPFWCLMLGATWLLHNAEEWLFAGQMLQFMQSDAPGFLRDAHAGITVREIQGVLAILTALLLVVLATAAAFSSAGSSVFVVMVLAALLGLNAAFHVALLMYTRVYAAGLATAVLLSLPVAAALLIQARRQQWAPASLFWVVAPAALLVHGPVLDLLFAMSLSVMRN